MCVHFLSDLLCIGKDWPALISGSALRVLTFLGSSIRVPAMSSPVVSPVSPAFQLRITAGIP